MNDPNAKLRALSEAIIYRAKMFERHGRESPYFADAQEQVEMCKLDLLLTKPCRTEGVPMCEL